ncbi:MAG: SdpI family protein [bacterium]|nr:SdpI family protein [bacterium]
METSIVILLSFAIGLLFIGLAIPLIQRKIPPNGFYGFRTQKTLASTEAWYNGNQYSGKTFLVAGAVVFLSGIVFLILQLSGVALPINLALNIHLGLLLFSVAASLFASYRYIKKYGSMPETSTPPPDSDDTELESSTQNKTLTILATIGLALGLLLPFLYWSSVPDSIPRHFNAMGKPDAWTKHKSILLLLPGISLIVYIKLGVVGWYIGRNSTRNTILRNPQQQAKITRTCLTWIRLEIIWLFTYIEWQTISISLGESEGLGTTFMPALLAVIIGTTAVFAYQGYKASRSP